MLGVTIRYHYVIETRKRRVAWCERSAPWNWQISVGRSLLRTSMGPHSSISGELPIDSYFSSVGAISNKDNGSRKRRTGTGADDANWTQTKKQRTTQPSKALNLDVQGKSRSGMICNIFGSIADWQPNSSIRISGNAAEGRHCSRV